MKSSSVIYDIVSTGAVLLGSPYLLWRRFGHPDEMKERFARGKPGLVAGREVVRPVWWHAASVGELEALKPVLRKTREARSGNPHLVTLLTPTGRARAVQIWGDGVDVRMVPLDWFPLVRRHFNQTGPRSLILVETELWPAMISAAHSRKIPVAVINGRLSARNISKYRSLKWVFKPLLERMSCVAARSSEDADSFRELGVPSERICVAGNTKYEMPVRPPVRQSNGPSSNSLRAASWIEEDDWSSILVLGSLRSEERDPVKEFLHYLKDKLPDPGRTLIILAPRHLERTSLFSGLVGELGFNPRRRSEIETRIQPEPDRPSVVLLDTLGELSDLWWNATVGLVGGTFAPLGGHNLFESASRGCPTFYGPSIDTVADVAAALEKTGGGCRFSDGAALGLGVLELLKNNELRRERSGQAVAAARSLSGGVQRTLDWLEHWGVESS